MPYYCNVCRAQHGTEEICTKDPDVTIADLLGRLFKLEHDYALLVKRVAVIEELKANRSGNDIN